MKISAEGLSARQADARFGVGVSSAIRWSARAKIGEFAPRAQGHRRASSLDVHDASDVGLIEERKDITLNEMVEQLAFERSVCVSRRALSACFAPPAGHTKKVRIRTGEVKFDMGLDQDPAHVSIIANTHLQCLRTDR